MKKIIYIWLIVLVIFVSCKPENTKEEDAVKTEIQERVKVKGYARGNFGIYEIVIVDGQEYLSSSRGGLVKLEKKTEE